MTFYTDKIFSKISPQWRLIFGYVALSLFCPLIDHDYQLLSARFQTFVDNFLRQRITKYISEDKEHFFSKLEILSLYVSVLFRLYQPEIVLGKWRRKELSSVKGGDSDKAPMISDNDISHSIFPEDRGVGRNPKR